MAHNGSQRLGADRIDNKPRNTLMRTFSITAVQSEITGADTAQQTVQHRIPNHSNQMLSLSLSLALLKPPPITVPISFRLLLRRNNMTRTTRASTPIGNPKLRTKRPRLERGEHSREQPSGGEGTRREKRGGGGGGGGGEGIVVISSDDDVVPSSADDVLLSEDLQIQEVLFMSMQSEKKCDTSFPLETEEVQGNGSKIGVVSSQFT